VYVLGAKIKQNFFQYKLLFQKMGTLMKNKALLLVIYTENKPCTDYAKKKMVGGRENKAFNYILRLPNSL